MIRVIYNKAIGTLIFAACVVGVAQAANAPVPFYVGNFCAQKYTIQTYGYGNASSQSYVAVDDVKCEDRENSIHIYARHNLQAGPRFVQKRHAKNLAIVTDNYLVSGCKIEDGLWVDTIAENANPKNI